MAADITKDVILNLVLKAEKAAQDTEALLVLMRELRKVLDEIGKIGPEAFKKLDAEIRKASGGLKDLSSITGKLSSSYRDAAKEAENLSNKFGKSQAEAGSLNDLTNRLKAVKAELNNTAQTVDGKVNPAYKRLEAEYAEINGKIAKQRDGLRQTTLASQAAAGSTNDLRAKLRALNRELDNTNQADPKFGKLTKQARELTEQIKKAEAASGRFQRNVGNYPSLASGITSVGAAFGVTFAIGAVVDKVGQAISSTIEVGKKFEASISNLSAITGASGKDLEFFREQAKRLGVETTSSAAEVAEAFKLLASAKPELLSNKEALVEVTEATIRLAEASGLAVPEAANALTTALNQMKLPASEASRVVDILAAGAKFGSAEIPELAEAFKKFGPVAKAAGIDVAQSVAAIETLGESKFEASIAGNALKNIFIKLQKEGVGVLSDGTLDLGLALDTLAPKVKDVTYLSELFGLENVAAAQALIEGRETYEAFTSNIAQSANVAAEQARINNDNLIGDTKRLQNTIEGIQINFYERFSGGLRDATQGFTKFLTYLSEGIFDGLKYITEPFKEWYDTIKEIFSAFGDLFKEALTLFGDAGKDVNAFSLILRSIGKSFEYVLEPVIKMGKRIVEVVKFLTRLKEAFLDAVDRVNEFIASSPVLSKAVEVIGKAFTTVKDAVYGAIDAVVGFGKSALNIASFGLADKLFGDAEVTYNRMELMEAKFGTFANALEELRKKFGGSVQDMQDFQKQFDKSLVVGLGFGDTAKVIQDEYIKFLTVKKDAQDKAAAEEQDKLEQEQATRQAALDKQREQQAEQQRLYDQALKQLQDQAAKEKELLLAKTEEGLEIIRQSKLAELRQNKAFAALTGEEQKLLLDAVNADIDTKLATIRKARAEATKKDLEESIKETLAYLTTVKDTALFLLEKGYAEGNEILFEQEQAALAQAGNDLAARLAVEKEYNLLRQETQAEYNRAKLEAELQQVTNELAIADLSTEARFAAEQKQFDLLQGLRQLEVDAVRKAEEEKRAELAESERLRQELVTQSAAAINNITALYVQDAEMNIAMLQAKTAANEAEQKRLDEAVKREEIRKQKALAVSKKIAAAQMLIDQTQIVVNSVKAITEGAKVPFPGNLVAIASIVAAVAAGIANIKTLVTPTRFAEGGRVTDGGLAVGPSHAAGGIAGRVRATGQPIEFEGGEYIVRKSSVTPHTLPILRQINNYAAPPIPRHVPKFAMGGMVGGGNAGASIDTGAITKAIMEGMQQAPPSKAYVVLSDLRGAESVDTRKRNKASMGGI